MNETDDQLTNEQRAALAKVYNLLLERAAKRKQKEKEKPMDKPEQKQKGASYPEQN